jgi:hypothetical protein
MLAIHVTLNIFLVAGLLAASFIVGFIARGSQIPSLRSKVNELEKEILASHAEILQVQREKIDLMKSISEPAIPVIPINSGKDEKAAEKNPDVTTRKKLLGNQSSAKQQSGS